MERNAAKINTVLQFPCKTERERKRPSAKERTARLAYVGICVALLSVCGWLTVPMPVPFTMQTFGVFFCLLLLGGRGGSAAIAVYVLLGAIGAPIFSGFGGGVGVLAGPTGGYIVGFLFIGLTYWLATKFFGERASVKYAALLIGLAACYAFGTFWFVTVLSQSGKAVGVSAALLTCVAPYIAPDLLKLCLAASVAAKLIHRLRLSRR